VERCVVVITVSDYAHQDTVNHFYRL
jgi:hypothetical protein